MSQNTATTARTYLTELACQRVQALTPYLSARRIGGSLCNVTRGARLLRDPGCASAALMARLEKPSPNHPA